MYAIEDAWREDKWDAVIYFDADIIITDSFITQLVNLPQKIVLSPHHHPPQLRAQAITIGRFNAGFVLTKSPEFHAWWREAFLARPERFVEQGCLNDAPGIFDVALLDHRANVGWWRRTGVTSFAPIPPDCLFVHVHLFQPVRNLYGFQQKSFAMHCLEFLFHSEKSEHRSIVEAILSRDSSGWYADALEEMRFLQRSSALVRRPQKNIRS